MAQYKAALRWIDNYGDVNGDGFVEYKRMQKMVNQPGMERLSQFGNVQ